MNPWLTPEQAIEAIKTGRGKGVKIAVLDSGIEANHPALNGLELLDDIAVIEDGYKLKHIHGEGRDLFGHGTAIANIIRATAPEAQIGSFRVLGQALSSRTAIIFEGARLAIDRGYHILNCSLGCGVPEHVLRYKSWVDAAYVKGVHVVAACNNSDFNRPEWPAFFTSVLTVNMARTEKNGDLYYRPGHLVEFAARGVDVEVAWAAGSFKKVTGSSFAAPRVTGMLACLVSQAPKLTPMEAKVLFHRLARPWTRDMDGPNCR